MNTTNTRGTIWFRRGLALCLLFALVFSNQPFKAQAANPTVDPALQAAGPAIHDLVTNLGGYPNSQVPRFEKLELTFQVDTQAANPQMPYDSAPPAGVQPGMGVSVDALFSADNFRTVYTQPAFYFQDYLDQVKSGQEWFYPSGKFAWKVRFSPNQTGAWQFKLRAQDASGTSETPPQSFTVAASADKGPIQVSKTDSRYFEYKDGTYFPSLGYNMTWGGVSSTSPVLDNEENFSKMSQNGIQMVRMWLSQWSIYGSAWNPWNSIISDQHAQYIPFNGITVEQSYGSSDASMVIQSSYNPCMFLGFMAPAPAVKANTNYRIRIRYKTTGITGAKAAGSPYGLVAKTGGWLWDGNNCNTPGAGTAVTPYQSQNTADWQILTGSLNTGSSNFLPYFYLVMDNVSGGKAYIDYVWIEEDLGGGQYGPNILPKPWMAQHLYFDQRNSYAFDKVVTLAEKYGVYLRPVIEEKNETLLNSFDYNGKAVPEDPRCYDSDPGNDPAECPGNQWFYGDGNTVTKTRWLQQAWWRYLQARWGYSSNIHSWELVNEGDPFNGDNYALTNAFAKYMHQFQPDDHMVSTSFWHSFPKDEFWGNPAYSAVDFADVHQYIPQSDPTFGDTAQATYNISMRYGARTSGGAGKPVIRGETGLSVSGTEPPSDLVNKDTQGTWLHDFIWGGINPGGLIESYWYTDSHIYRASNGVYQFDFRPQYRTYYNFIKDIPLSNGSYVEAAAASSNANLVAWGQKDLASGRAHLWINNKLHTWQAVVNGTSIPAQSGTVTLSGFKPGAAYSVQWWDTYQPDPAKQVTRTDTLTAQSDGSLALQVQNLASDLAVKISGSAPMATPTAAPTTLSNLPTPTATRIPPTATAKPAFTPTRVTGRGMHQAFLPNISAAQAAALVSPSSSLSESAVQARRIYLSLISRGVTSPPVKPPATATPTKAPTAVPTSTGPTPVRPTATPTAVVTTPATPPPASGSPAWPMVAANPQRTSHTTEEVSGALHPVWYRPIEAFIPTNVQVIASDGMLYISSARGLYALDANNGNVIWRYDTEMPLGNSPTVDNHIVYVGGYDRKIHALDARTGAHLWSFDGAQAGYNTNPLVVNGKVIMGNRDGYMYAVGAQGAAQQGQLVWKFQTGGPINISAAYNNGVVYFAAMDNYGYALNADTGALVWKTKTQMPGDGFQSYWAMIYQDKVVFSGASPYRDQKDPGTKSMKDASGIPYQSLDSMQRDDIFFDQSTLGPTVSDTGAWRHNLTVIDASRASEYLEANPTTDLHLHKPWRRSLMVINQSDGSEYTTDVDHDGNPEYAPFLWYGTHSGNAYPAILSGDNVLYRSNPYESGYIPQGLVMGWSLGTSHMSLTNIQGADDEPQALSSGGNIIYRSICCDRVGDWFNVATGEKGGAWGYAPFDLSTQIPGYDQMWWGIDPNGLPRWSGNYGTRNGVYNEHGDQNPIVPYNGKLFIIRSNAVVAFGKDAGTSKLPLLTAQAAATTSTSLALDNLKTRLSTEIQKMLDAGHLRPGYMNSGAWGYADPSHLPDYFINPGETVLTMARAYPYLPATQQAQVKTYLQNEFNTYFSSTMYARTGWSEGAAREWMPIPPDIQASIDGSKKSTWVGDNWSWNYPPLNIYALWKFAGIAPENTTKAYSLAKSNLAVPCPAANSYFTQYPYELNAWIAGYYGFLKLQEAAGMTTTDAAMRQSVSNELNRLQQLRASTFSKDTPWLDPNDPNKTPDSGWQYNNRALNVANNFIYLTPELGSYLNQNALAKVQDAMNEYSWVAPYWFVSRFNAAVNEGAVQQLYDYNALFQAKAYILKQSRDELSKYLDVPAFQRGDLLYIQNIIAAIEAP